MRPLQQLGSHSCPLPCPGALAHPAPPHTAPHSGEAPDFGRAPSSRGRPRVFRFSVSAALGRPRCSASDEPARGPCPGGDLWRGGQRPGDRVLGAPALAGAVPRSHLVSRGTGCPRACDRHVAKSLGFRPSGQRERDLEAVWALAGSAGASGRLAVRAGYVAGHRPPPGGLAAAPLLPSPCRLWGFLFIGRSFSRVAIVSPATVTPVARAHGAFPAQTVSCHAGKCVFGWRLLDAGPALWTPPPSRGVRSPPRSSQRGRGVLSGPRL